MLFAGFVALLQRVFQCVTHFFIIAMFISNYFPPTKKFVSARVGRAQELRRKIIKGNGCVVLSTENIMHGSMSPIRKQNSFARGNNILSLFTICLLLLLSHFVSFHMSTTSTASAIIDVFGRENQFSSLFN